MTTRDTPEAEALVKALSENRCGDEVCEELRFRAALDVLTGRGRKAHNGNAIALAAINEPNENPEPPVPSTRDTPEAALAAALVMLMVEEGFAVPAANRDEQWDAPVEEAKRIATKALGALERDGWALLPVEHFDQDAELLAEAVRLRSQLNARGAGVLAPHCETDWCGEPCGHDGPCASPPARAALAPEVPR